MGLVSTAFNNVKNGTDKNDKENTFDTWAKRGWRHSDCVCVYVCPTQSNKKLYQSVNAQHFHSNESNECFRLRYGIYMVSIWFWIWTERIVDRFKSFPIGFHIVYETEKLIVIISIYVQFATFCRSHMYCIHTACQWCWYGWSTIFDLRIVNIRETIDENTYFHWSVAQFCWVSILKDLLFFGFAWS